MFMLVNDTDAMEIVKQIVSQFGFIPDDMGAAEAARAIESLCI